MKTSQLPDKTATETSRRAVHRGGRGYGVMLRGGPRSVFNLENIRLLTGQRIKI